MKIRINKNLLFREYDDFGYLLNSKTSFETVISKSACVLFRFLTDEYQDFNTVLDELYIFFSVEEKDKKNVADDFYQLLQNLNCGHFYDIEDSSQFDSKDSFSENTSNNCNNGQEGAVLDMPSQFYAGNFIVTEDCNNRCLHCFNSYTTRNPCYMTQEIFEKGLKNCVDSGAVRIDISGGEALIHPNIEYFLSAVKETGLRFRLYSNGQNITERICSIMKDMRLSPVSVSLYSINPEVHDSITQCKGSWSNTVKGLRMFKKYGIPFQVSVAITKKNLDDFEKLLEFCEHDLGAVDVGPNPFISFTVNHKKTNEAIIPTVEDIRNFAERYVYYAAEKGYSILPRKKVKSPDYRLYGNDFYGPLTILPDGSIVPGALMPDIVLGNVTKDDIKTIWKTSSILNEWREYTISMLKDCDTCSCRDYCEPNIGDNWVANYDVLKCDKHLCDLNKKYYEVLTKNERQK